MCWLLAQRRKPISSPKLCTLFPVLVSLNFCCILFSVLRLGQEQWPPLLGDCVFCVAHLHCCCCGRSPNRNTVCTSFHFIGSSDRRDMLVLVDGLCEVLSIMRCVVHILLLSLCVCVYVCVWWIGFYGRYVLMGSGFKCLLIVFVCFVCVCVSLCVLVKF